MIKLKYLATLAWSHLTRSRRLLLGCVLVALLGLAAGVATLLASSSRPARTTAAARPAAGGSSPTAGSSVSTWSVPVPPAGRSTSAATPTMTGSASRRPGPAPSSHAALTTRQAAAPGHPTGQTYPSSPAPGRPRGGSHAPAPSTPRPRPTHSSSPASVPAHVIGDGGLVGSTNTFRASNGVGQLAYSSSLSSDAKACALRMAQNSSVAHCGGNQVVAGAWSAGGCMSLFESESAHREVLLSPAFASAGSGVAVDEAGAYYCVINFA